MKLIKFILTILPVVAFAFGTATLTLPTMGHADSHMAMAEHGTLHVTKDPTCGCCSAWVALAREEGYEVETTDTADVTDVKLEAGVPDTLWACHTARIGGYVIEGHVPFKEIARLLKERPAIAGIAVPGMPVGSPGMGSDPSARFDVIAFGGTAGAGKVFSQAGQ